MLRICVFYDEETYGFSPAPFLNQYPCEWEMRTLSRPVADKIKKIAAENKFDVYFNLCDGVWDEDYPGIDVIQTLEELNLAFTGANSKCYDPTREEMQTVAEANNVRFARGYRVHAGEDVIAKTKGMKFPLMVKHPQSYGSWDMKKEARVDDEAQLVKQFSQMAEKFGSARVEEFIVGREFNVLVVENPDNLDDPFVYPPTELIFPPGEEFWHEDVKWNYSVPFEFRQVMDTELAKRIQDIGKRFFKAMGCTGYGRCDLRMSADGDLVILEINPNGGILYLPEEYGPADYMILYDKDGYYGFFDRIFKTAQVRQKLRAEGK
jgi:D-alanine-D-alanine ligase